MPPAPARRRTTDTALGALFSAIPSIAQMPSKEETFSTVRIQAVLAPASPPGPGTTTEEPKPPKTSKKK